MSNKNRVLLFGENFVNNKSKCGNHIYGCISYTKLFGWMMKLC